MKCLNDTVVVPLRQAAEGVILADLLAAVRVIARWSRVYAEAAFVRVGTALEIDAQFLRPVCAELVPEHLATERIDAADGVAAGWVLASRGILSGWVSGRRAGSPVWGEQHRYGATRDSDAAGVVCQHGAEFVPLSLATKRLVAADQLAACGVAAVRRRTREGAIPGGVRSAAESVGVFDRGRALAANASRSHVRTRHEDALYRCEFDAIDIPLFVAAGWVEPADQ